MDSLQTNIHAAIVQQASEWFVAHRSGALSAQERKAFNAWLRTSPTHVREYLAVSKLAGAFGAVTQAFDVGQLVATANEECAGSTGTAISAASHNRSSGRRPWSGFGYVPWLSAAVVAIVAVVFFQWRGADALETTHGEQRIWRLADGSVVHLNSGSRLSIKFTAAVRQVDIVRGQALFEVARDPTRPFQVRAGDTQVTAVGTSFDVYLKPQATLVTVVEGKVRVTSDASAAVAAAPINLAAGQQLSLAMKGMHRSSAGARPTTADVAKATAWSQQQIVFEQERLADVVQEFNRYGRVPIEIEGAALTDLRITGIFNAYDTDSFLDFLRKLDGVAVEASAQRIRVNKNHGT